MRFETSVTKCPMVQLKHQADITLKKGPRCVFRNVGNEMSYGAVEAPSRYYFEEGTNMCFRNVGNEMPYGAVEAPSRYSFEEGTNMCFRNVGNEMSYGAV